MPDPPARHFNLAGASNFRDLGGYRTTDGRAVRWLQIFRSNHLGHLTEADIEVLSLPIEPTVVAALRTRLADGVPLSSADAVEVMRESYRNYVRHNTPSFRALFALLLEDRAPLVIHCTAGKD